MLVNWVGPIIGLANISYEQIFIVNHDKDAKAVCKMNSER